MPRLGLALLLKAPRVWPQNQQVSHCLLQNLNFTTAAFRLDRGQRRLPPVEWKTGCPASGSRESYTLQISFKQDSSIASGVLLYNSWLFVIGDLFNVN